MYAYIYIYIYRKDVRNSLILVLSAQKWSVWFAESAWSIFF